MKFNQTYQLILENKLEDELNKARDSLNIIQYTTVRKVNDKLTNQHKYVKFLIKGIQDAGLAFSISKLAADINYAEEHWNELENKDLQHMSFEDLQDEVLKLEAKKYAKTHENELNELIKEAKTDVNVDIIKLTEEYVILRPLCFEASNHYGMYCNTNSWCIVAQEQYWKSYFKNSVFYFILFKSVPSDKKSDPWFKTCVQVRTYDGKRTCWNFFDESECSLQIQSLNLDERLFKSLGDFINEESEEKQVIIAKQFPQVIQLIKNPSEKVQEIVVTELPSAISFIKNSSDKIKKIAISKIPSLIGILQNKQPDEDLKRLAIEIDPFSIQYIYNPSEELQLLAVKKNLVTLDYIANPTEKVIKEYEQRRNNYILKNKIKDRHRQQTV